MKQFIIDEAFTLVGMAIGVLIGSALIYVLGRNDKKKVANLIEGDGEVDSMLVVFDED